MKRPIYPLLFVLTGILLALVPNVFAGGMESQTDNIFMEMQNYTKPGAYQSMRRSAYVGGHFVLKSKIYRPDLVSLTTPSARGGCGGIDAFGGSFSFVNSDQIVALFRQTASNAKGYAFQLAMDNVCPNCSKWMETLQDKVEKMNSHLQNSCQMAQGLINDASNSNIMPFTIKNQTNDSLMGSLNGVGEDFVDLTNHIKSASTAFERNDAANPAINNDKSGAIIYKALKKHNAQNWYVGGDTELLETIMAITGSIVIGEGVTGSEGSGKTADIRYLPGNLVTIHDLIEGGQNKTIYNCAADTVTTNCRIIDDDIKKITKTINLTGLKTKIQDAFIGPNGVVTAIAQGQINGTLTQNQQNIMAAMPHSIGSKIFELAPLSPDAASDLVIESIDAITLEYIHRLVLSSFEATRLAITNTENTFNPAALSRMQESQKKVEAEYKELLQTYGSSSEIEQHYALLINSIPKPEYLPGAQASHKSE